MGLTIDGVAPVDALDYFAGQRVGAVQLVGVVNDGDEHLPGAMDAEASGRVGARSNVLNVRAELLARFYSHRRITPMARGANFKVDPKLAHLLGEGYHSTERALKELVDNAWDAEAEHVWITLPAVM